MRIAIVKLSALGDIIHAMVALQFIKKQRPDVTIDWVVEQNFKPVLENNPDIHQIHTVNLKKAKQQKSFRLLFSEFKKLRKLPKYDLVIDAQGLIKSAIVAKLIRSDRVSGFDKQSIRESLAAMMYDYTTAIAYDANTIDRNVKVICSPLGVVPTVDDVANKQPFLFFQDAAPVTLEAYAVFVIGSTWESRNYPKQQFALVAEALKMTCVVVWGNESERAKALWMSEQSNHIKVAPKLDLNELKQMIHHSSLLIGNDTGPTHMAWGLNVPSITLFGPTPINRVHQTTINKALKSSSKVDHFHLNKDDFSIKEIKVKDIVKISKELLQEAK